MDAIIIVSETECKKKKKGKGRILIQRCLHDDRTSALYNLESGS